MTSLDKAAVFAVLVLGALIGGILFWGSKIPIFVTCVQPVNCSEIGPRGGMVFEFSRPVDLKKLDVNWQFNPTSAGKWQRLDDKHVKWISTLPIDQVDQITFGFMPGVVGEENEAIGSQISWTSKLRQSRILAINSSGSETELYLLDPNGKQEARQLTHTGGKTYDYDVDPAGELIIFSVINQESGADLWKIDRDGNEQALLLACGTDRCTAPIWSPTRNEIAYTREISDPKKKGALGAPRIWMLNPLSGATSALFEDKQQIGYGTSWTSDGIWMSIWDGMSGGIKIVNRETGENFLVQSSSGNSGCWTVDRKYLIFSNTIFRDTGYHNVILRVNVEDQSLETILGENSESGGTSYDNPQCNPLDDRLALTIQPNIKIPGRALVVYDTDTLKQTDVENDLSLIPGQYSWDSPGSRLLFQVDKLTSNQGNTQIRVWENRRIRTIATGFRFPKWLP
jgi:hypothetical protein